MHQLHKYVFCSDRGDLILADGRPGGTQYDHVTAYAVFKQTIRSLDTHAPLETAYALITMIDNIRKNYDIFSDIKRSRLERKIGDGESEVGEVRHRRSARIALAGAVANVDELNSRVDLKKEEIENITLGLKSRDKEQRIKFMELKEELSSCKSALKASQSRFKDALLLQPTASEIDGMMDEIKDDLESIAENTRSDDEIDAIIAGIPEENRGLVASSIRYSHNVRCMNLLVKLANVYLIVRNKQTYSAFRRVGDIAPPSDESEKVSQAIKTLDDLLNSDVGKEIRVKNISKILSAINDLFWYPYVKYSHATSVENKSDKYTRVDDDDDVTAFVLAEHLDSIFIAFPDIHPESKKIIINEFISSQADKLQIMSGDARLEFVENVKKNYLYDDMESVSSFTDDSDNDSISDNLSRFYAPMDESFEDSDSGEDYDQMDESSEDDDSSDDSDSMDDVGDVEIAINYNDQPSAVSSGKILGSLGSGFGYDQRARKRSRAEVGRDADDMKEVKVRNINH